MLYKKFVQCATFACSGGFKGGCLGAPKPLLEPQNCLLLGIINNDAGQNDRLCELSLTLYTVVLDGRVDTWPWDDRSADWTREVGHVVSSGQCPRQSTYSSAELACRWRQSGRWIGQRGAVAVPRDRRHRVAACRRTIQLNSATLAHVLLRRVDWQLWLTGINYITHHHLHHHHHHSNSQQHAAAFCIWPTQLLWKTLIRKSFIHSLILFNYFIIIWSVNSNGVVIDDFY